MFDPLVPFRILKDALSRVRGLKILFGVIAVLAILAIARVWSLDRGWTIIGGIAVVAFAVVLLALAKLSTAKASVFAASSARLLDFCILLFMFWAILLTTCVFFQWPVRVQDLPINPVTPNSRIDKLPDRFLTDSQRAAIKAVCSKHRGQKFLIQSATNTPEAGNFGAKIYKVLTAECGWVGEMHVLMTMNLGPGVAIASGSEDVKAGVAKQPSTLPLASALHHAMEDSGVVMMEGGTLDANSIPKGVIVIAVGPKPY